MRRRGAKDRIGGGLQAAVTAERLEDDEPLKNRRAPATTAARNLPPPSRQIPLAASLGASEISIVYTIRRAAPHDETERLEDLLRSTSSAPFYILLARKRV